MSICNRETWLNSGSHRAPPPPPEMTFKEQSERHVDIRSVALSNCAPQGTLSGSNFGCPTKGRGTTASNRWRSEMLLNSLWCRGQPSKHRVIWSKMSNVPRLRAPALSRQNRWGESIKQRDGQVQRPGGGESMLSRECIKDAKRVGDQDEIR